MHRFATGICIAVSILTARPLAAADIVVAARTIRALDVITAEDLVVSGDAVEGAFSDIGDVVGLEARKAIYAGRAISLADVGPPALIERNQTVTLVYMTGTLTIAAEGRALARGAAGDLIKVMNIASRVTLYGRVEPDGSVRVMAGI